MSSDEQITPETVSPDTETLAVFNRQSLDGLRLRINHLGCSGLCCTAKPYPIHLCPLCEQEALDKPDGAMSLYCHFCIRGVCSLCGKQNLCNKSHASKCERCRNQVCYCIWKPEWGCAQRLRVVENGVAVSRFLCKKCLHPNAEKEAEESCQKPQKKRKKSEDRDVVFRT